MSDDIKVTTAEMLKRLAAGWTELQTFIKSLSEEQLTQLTDAAGWTVKDHLMHLAVWENGMNALLKSLPRNEAMHIDEETWLSGDFDKMNAIIQQQYKDKPLADVLKTMQDVHAELVERITTMSDDDLMLPYNTFQPGTSRDTPVWQSLVGNTFGHYEEHIPWMQAIVEGA